jgi:hypothetical protein
MAEGTNLMRPIIRLDVRLIDLAEQPFAHHHEPDNQQDPGNRKHGHGAEDPAQERRLEPGTEIEGLPLTFAMVSQG